MRLLVLGGAAFVGRAIVEQALRRGEEVTVFSRGRTGADLFPGVPRLIGDRESGDYRALSGGRWDAAVDVSGYFPSQVGGAMAALAGAVERYLFISSHAVYQPHRGGPGSTEDAPRRQPLRDAETLDDQTYGPLKVACEDDVLDRYGPRATVVRPGKVAGPHDPSDIFTYWVRRAAGGGTVAIPGDPDQPVQVIDVRDLAQLVVQLLEDRRPGAFNAVGPPDPVTLGQLVQTCAEAAGTDVEIIPVPRGSAHPHFPLIRSDWSSQQRSSARARAAGMPSTPLARTAADVLAWDRERGLPPLGAGFSGAEERALLQARADPGARPAGRPSG